jgi:hypothetical protein
MHRKELHCRVSDNPHKFEDPESFFRIGTIGALYGLHDGLIVLDFISHRMRYSVWF